MHFNGMPIVIISETSTVYRSWRERLFTLPWRPFQETQIVVNEACPPDGEVLTIEGRLFMNSNTADQLRKHVRAAPPTSPEPRFDGWPMVGVPRL